MLFVTFFCSNIKDSTDFKKICSNSQEINCSDSKNFVGLARRVRKTYEKLMMKGIQRYKSPNVAIENWCVLTIQNELRNRELEKFGRAYQQIAEYVIKEFKIPEPFHQYLIGKCKWRGGESSSSLELNFSPDLAQQAVFDLIHEIAEHHAKLRAKRWLESILRENPYLEQFLVSTISILM